MKRNFIVLLLVLSLVVSVANNVSFCDASSKEVKLQYKYNKDLNGDGQKEDIKLVLKGAYRLDPYSYGIGKGKGYMYIYVNGKKLYKCKLKEPSLGLITFRVMKFKGNKSVLEIALEQDGCSNGAYVFEYSSNKVRKVVHLGVSCGIIEKSQGFIAEKYVVKPLKSLVRIKAGDYNCIKRVSEYKYVKGKLKIIRSYNRYGYEV